jgi:hypothetical protein
MPKALVVDDSRAVRTILGRTLKAGERLHNVLVGASNILVGKLQLAGIHV